MVKVDYYNCNGTNNIYVFFLRDSHDLQWILSGSIVESLNQGRTTGSQLSISTTSNRKLAVRHFLLCQSSRVSIVSAPLHPNQCVTPCFHSNGDYCHYALNTSFSKSQNWSNSGVSDGFGVFAKTLMTLEAGSNAVGFGPLSLLQEYGMMVLLSYSARSFRPLWRSLATMSPYKGEDLCRRLLR